ncbi:Tn3 family transposase [Streptomyces hydrogenans]|nr:Tn3 family transposase [Streptomyces hydrogenans]
MNLKRIATHWPDMLRVAGSLITNQVRAYDLLRMFGREGHPDSARRRVRRVRPGSTRPCICSPWSTRSTTPTAG